MCPKLGNPCAEEQLSSRRMTTRSRLVCQEDKNDSGLHSLNLPSLRSIEPDMISSLQNEFTNMTIACSPPTCGHDSGVYASFSRCSRRHSEPDNIDTLCDVQCDNENSTMNISGKDDEHYSRSHGIIQQIHIRADQAALLYEGDKDGDNKLHLSIINGQVACSILLINLAIEYTWLDFGNHLRQTPLHLAVLTRQPKIARRLICAGATVLAQDKQGDTPLHIACRLGDTEIVKCLLTPVQYEETLQNRYNIPYQRVPQDLRVRNYEGETCLHVAASCGHHNVVQLLLDAGADINMGDGKSGRTILHLGVDRRDMELVELLLSYSELNVKKRDYAGLTPIQLAYGRRNPHMVNIIYSLSGEYEGVLMSDPQISLNDEDFSDDCYECCDPMYECR